MSVNDTTTPTYANGIIVGEEETAADPPRVRTCYSRFWMDLTGTFRCAPSFRAVDVLHKTDGSTETKLIDVNASFSPPMGMATKTTNKKVFTLAKVGVVIWKLFVFLLQAMTFLAGFIPFPNAIWFAYLTNLSLLMAMIYSGLSLVNTIFPVATDSSSVSDDSKDTSEEGVVSTRTRITWAFFTLAGFLQTLITVLYWALLHPPEARGLFLYSMIILHGGVAALILVDGLLVNRIPIRMRHWLEICLPFTFMYALWSLLQSPLALDLENPYMDAFGADDDKIYPVLDWEEKPMLTLALILVSAFVVSPIFYTLLWAVSLPGRKYIDAREEIVEADTDIDEEAVIE